MAHTQLSPEQLDETVQALHARLAETRSYLRSYEGPTLVPHHDDCCPRQKGWAEARRGERDALRAREAAVIAALDVLDPARAATS